MNQVMVDLETLGNRPGCVVISIGAVLFDETSIGPEFYAEISQFDSERHGLRADLSTMRWWKSKPLEAARVVWRTSSEPSTSIHSLSDALGAFGAWLPSRPEVWGNGAAFDNVILAECFKAAGMKMPWDFKRDRCYRTLKSLFPEVPFKRTGTHHNALDDARSQAVHASAILRWMKTGVRKSA